MTDIINLRQKRKAKARAEKDKQAAINRLLHGRTGKEKQRQKMESDLATRRLDGHKLTTDAEDEA